MYSFRLAVVGSKETAENMWRTCEELSWKNKKDSAALHTSDLKTSTRLDILGCETPEEQQEMRSTLAAERVSSGKVSFSYVAVKKKKVYKV